MRVDLPDIPLLERFISGSVAWWSDARLRDVSGVVVAFSERCGGVSTGPYRGLDLGSHVGDDPLSVDANRDALLDALGLRRWRDGLVCAEQVHGDVVAVVGEDDRGSGASARGGRNPVPGADGLVTVDRGLPLMLCFADCVPVVLVAPGPSVAVVHAGWRGALARIPAVAVRTLSESAGCAAADILAYVGPHIGPCHYQVDDALMSHFVNAFDTVSRAESGGLDLGAVVNASLTDSGVDSCRIVALGCCTAEQTDHFYSYRAEGPVTGRHAAVACVLSP